MSGEQFIAYYLDNLAVRLATDGRSESANSAFTSALAIDPDSARLLYNYGSFLVSQGRFLEGLAALDRGIRAGWDNADASVNRGVARWELGDRDGARDDFAVALRFDPTNRAALRNQAALDPR